MSYSNVVSAMPAKPVEVIKGNLDLDAAVVRAENSKKDGKKKEPASQPDMPAMIAKLMEELIVLRQEVNELHQSQPVVQPLKPQIEPTSPSSEHTIQDQTSEQLKIPGIPEPWRISPSTWRKHHSKAQKRYTKYPNRRRKR